MNFTFYDNNISNYREIVMNKFNDLAYKYNISSIIDHLYLHSFTLRSENIKSDNNSVKYDNSLIYND